MERPQPAGMTAAAAEQQRRVDHPARQRPPAEQVHVAPARPQTGFGLTAAVFANTVGVLGTTRMAAREVPAPQADVPAADPLTYDEQQSRNARAAADGRNAQRTRARAAAPTVQAQPAPRLRRAPELNAEQLAEEVAAEHARLGTYNYHASFCMLLTTRNKDNFKALIASTFGDVKVDKVITIIEELNRNPRACGDNEIYYNELKRRIASEASYDQVRGFCKNALTLGKERKEFKRQATLLALPKDIDGYVEFARDSGTMYQGLPNGTRLKGRVIIVRDEKLNLAQKAVRFLGKIFMPLTSSRTHNDHTEALRALASRSIDVINIPKGLSHFTDITQLNAFMEQCSRVLRVGGRIIISHHNEPNGSLAASATKAQRILQNAHANLPYDSVDQNTRSQIRDSHLSAPSNELVRTLEDGGYTHITPTGPSAKEGDITSSELLSFSKTPGPDDRRHRMEYLTLKDRARNSGYERDGINTLFAPVKTQRDDHSTMLSRHLAQHPIYTFNFFAEIPKMWNVFGGAVSAAAKNHGLAKTVFGNKQMILALSINIVNTVAFIFKGIAALCLRGFNAAANFLPMEVLRNPTPENVTRALVSPTSLLRRITRDYADHQHSSSPEGFHHGREIKAYWARFQQSLVVARRDNGASLPRLFFNARVWTNLSLGIFHTLDFGLKALLALPFKNERSTETVKVIIRNNNPRNRGIVVGDIPIPNTALPNGDLQAFRITDIEGDHWLAEIPKRLYQETLRHIASVPGSSIMDIEGSDKVLISQNYEIDEDTDLRNLVRDGEENLFHMEKSLPKIDPADANEKARKLRTLFRLVDTASLDLSNTNTYVYH